MSQIKKLPLACLDEIHRMTSALRAVRDLMAPDPTFEPVKREDLTTLLEVVIEQLQGALDRAEQAATWT